jgi:hypothetical protein
MNAMRIGMNARICGLVLALGGAGCSAAVGDDPEVQEEGVGVESSRLVHSIDVGDGHTLEFYDFGEGQVGIKEEYAMGDKPLLDDAVALEASTLADLYRRVSPETLVPAAIVAADAHAADTLSKPQKVYETLPERAAPAEEEVGTVQSAVVSCSPDHFNDNWSAQWFIDNFGSLWNYNCTGVTGFVNVNRATNLTKTDYYAGGSYSWLWRAFEGDFNVSGSFSIFRNGFGLPANIPLASGSIPPRKVVAWTIKGGWSNQVNHATSRSGCGHAGAAQAWCGF